MKSLRFLLRRLGRWSSEHRDAWSVARASGPDGLTAFQVECELRLSSALAARGLSLEQRQIEPFRWPGEEPELMVVACVPNLSAEVWIYADQTEIKTPGATLRLEAWDTKTPEEHYARVEAFVASLP